MEEQKVGYRGIKASSIYKFRTSVGCGSRTCVRERILRNEIPNHPSKRSPERVNIGSGAGWVGSRIAWLKV